MVTVILQKAYTRSKNRSIKILSSVGKAKKVRTEARCRRNIHIY